jgi:hypothetical protein
LERAAAREQRGRLVRRVALLAAAAAAATLLAAPADAQKPSVEVTSAISPGPHLFADRILAELTVLVDEARTDPNSVRVDTSFVPWERVGGIERSRDREGGTVRLRYRYTIECIFSNCIPDTFKTERKYDLPPATVRYRLRKGGKFALLVRWPSFRLVSRFPIPKDFGNVNDVQSRLQFQNDPLVRLFATVQPPASTYRLGSTTLGILFFAVALVCLGAAAIIARPIVAELRARRARREGREATPLEQAVELVELTARRHAGEPEHREALGRLARELRQAGMRDVAPAARRLAWSEHAPSQTASDELTRQVRAAMEEAA